MKRFEKSARVRRVAQGAKFHGSSVEGFISRSLQSEPQRRAAAQSDGVELGSAVETQGLRDAGKGHGLLAHLSLAPEAPGCPNVQIF